MDYAYFSEKMGGGEGGGAGATAHPPTRFLRQYWLNPEPVYIRCMVIMHSFLPSIYLLRHVSPGCKPSVQTFL